MNTNRNNVIDITERLAERAFLRERKIDLAIAAEREAERYIEGRGSLPASFTTRAPLTLVCHEQTPSHVPMPESMLWVEHHAEVARLERFRRELARVSPAYIARLVSPRNV